MQFVGQAIPEIGWLRNTFSAGRSPRSTDRQREMLCAAAGNLARDCSLGRNARTCCTLPDGEIPQFRNQRCRAAVLNQLLPALAQAKLSTNPVVDIAFNCSQGMPTRAPGASTQCLCSGNHSLRRSNVQLGRLGDRAGLRDDGFR